VLGAVLGEARVRRRTFMDWQRLWMAACSSSSTSISFVYRTCRRRPRLALSGALQQDLVGRRP
jgi:hypothetical protein